MVGVILLSIYGLSNIGVKGQGRTNDRITSMLRHQNGLERMTREMRQAVDFTPVSAQVLDAETYVRPVGGGTSVLRRVRYECNNGSCVRYEGPSGGSLTSGPETVIPDVRNADVFFFEPDSVNPNLVTVKLEVGIKNARNPITLEGGFALHNEATHADDAAACVDDGFSLVEVLMGVTIMAVGIAATLQVFGGSGRTALAAQRAASPCSRHRRRSTASASSPYSALGLTSTPASSASPLDPGSRVSGTNFTVRTGLVEPFVLSSDPGQSAAAVSPTPTSFAVGVSDATVTGKIHRYVTWRDEICASRLHAAPRTPSESRLRSRSTPWDPGRAPADLRLPGHPGPRGDRAGQLASSRGSSIDALPRRTSTCTTRAADTTPGRPRPVITPLTTPPPGDLHRRAVTRSARTPTSRTRCSRT